MRAKILCSFRAANDKRVGCRGSNYQQTSKAFLVVLHQLTLAGKVRGNHVRNENGRCIRMFRRGPSCVGSRESVSEPRWAWELRAGGWFIGSVQIMRSRCSLFFRQRCLAYP
ncbi:hypothetical protein AVEN_97004-1 [Araneus ventricosus]|uniref:Uncharacterized protein n=1 Tax=Araneus ventricosus TaxID=182803 RepID=A0A4Y2FRZ3_ARAVE|nr:hypothetical protein AVEN_97004-1 [Araneus ventricosus]